MAKQFPQHKLLKYDWNRDEVLRDPNVVSLCFMMLPSHEQAQLIGRQSKPRAVVDQALLTLSPDFWRRVLLNNPKIPGYILGSDAPGRLIERLNPFDILETLIDVAKLPSTTSLLCRFPTISLDGGRSQTRVCAGYAFTQTQPCIIADLPEGEHKAGLMGGGDEVQTSIKTFTERLTSQFKNFVVAHVTVPTREVIAPFLGELPFVTVSGNQMKVAAGIHVLGLRNAAGGESTILIGGNLSPSQFHSLSKLADLKGYSFEVSLVGGDDWKRSFEAKVNALPKDDKPAQSKKGWRFWK